MVIVAVNVTAVPAQKVVLGVAIAMVGVTIGFTVIVMAFEVTDAGEAQDTEDESTHVIISPLASEEEVKVAPLAPDMFTLFFFHW